jgi:hypothetical protein
MRWVAADSGPVRSGEDARIVVQIDRMTDAMCKLTGEAPTNMRDFVKLHAAEFKQRAPANS